MEKMAREDHSYRQSIEEYERHQKHWYLPLNISGKKCTEETPIRLPNSSRHMNEPSPPRIRRNDQNQFLFNSTTGGTRLLLPVLHGGRGIKKKPVDLIIFEFCCSKFVDS